MPGWKYMYMYMYMHVGSVPICVQYWDGLDYNNVNNPYMKFTHKFLKQFFK